MINLQAMDQANNNLITSPSGTQYTNLSGLPMESAIFAIYFAETGYTGSGPAPKKISVSGLIGPIRKSILAILHPSVDRIKDVSEFVKSSNGTSFHESMEKALLWWGDDYQCEFRTDRTINGWRISGEFDIMHKQVIKDLKTMGNWVYGKYAADRAALQPGLSMEDLYAQHNHYFKFPAQLSMYRWLQNDDSIKPWGEIIFKLTDGGDFGKYPVDSIEKFPLFPTEQLEEFIINRTNLIDQHLDAGTLPLCTDAERGQSPGSYKLKRYSGTTGKWRTVTGSANFTSEAELSAFTTAKGKSGDKQEITPPSYKLCGFCQFQAICDQNNPST